MCRIALSMGDPAGVGPELLARAVGEPAFAGKCEFVLFGERDVLEEALRRFAPHVDSKKVEIVESSKLIKPMHFAAGQLMKRSKRRPNRSLTVKTKPLLPLRSISIL